MTDIYQDVTTSEHLDIVLLCAQHGPATRHELHRAYMTHTGTATDFNSFTNALRYLVRGGVVVTEPNREPPTGRGRPPVLYRLADHLPMLDRILRQILERLIGDDPDRLKAVEGYLERHLASQDTLV